MLWGKVTRRSAAADYGVVVTGSMDTPSADVAATHALRTELRAARPSHPPFFDRGPGYSTLAGGALAADCDWLA